MKKILFTTNVPAPYTVEFFEQLSLKFDLTVVYERKTAANREKEWFSEKGKSYEEIYLNGMNYGAEASFSLKIIGYLKKTYDIIIVGNYSSPVGIISILYLKFHKIPFYIHVDGGIKGEKEGIKKYIKSYLLSSAKGFFSPGSTVDEYITYYAGKTEIAHYSFSSVKQSEILSKPLENERKKRKIKELEKNVFVNDDDFVITSVGSIIYRKGYDVLLEAVSTIQKKVIVFIIGGEANDKLNSILKKKEIHNVFFVGFKKHSLINEYIQASDLFVLPTRYDIWGLVINEALAAGVPVITSDKCVAGLELIKDDYNGYLFHSEDAEDLRDCIKKVKNKPLAYREILANNALKTAREYTIESMVETYTYALMNYCNQ